MKKLVAGIAICLIIILLFVIFFKPEPPEGRSEKAESSFVVSILPLKSIVSKIIGDDSRIEVLVPPGASPETYEPTPKQLVSLSDADLIFTTGLIDFEHELIGKSADNKIINLSEGIELLAGHCGSEAHVGDHNHGVDPHIWTSPKQLKIMASNAFQAISVLHPDNETYQTNYRELLAELDRLDARVANTLDSAKVKYFFIYHPAMTYFARDYDIEQISIEQEGKEPSADRLKALIDLAREENITSILYQKEFARSVVETVAEEIGAIPIEIDPLSENILQSIVEITQHIIGNRE